MSTRYRVQLIVEVTDAAADDAYEWEQVAARVVRRLKNSARKPLDRDARLRIQGVYLDHPKELDDDA